MKWWDLWAALNQYWPRARGKRSGFRENVINFVLPIICWLQLNSTTYKLRKKNIIDKVCTFSLWILGVRSNSSLDIVHFGVSRSTGKWNFYEISNILSVLLDTIISTDWQRAASSHPSAVRQQQCSARLSASNFQRANIQIVKQRPVFPLSGLTIFLCHQTCNL